VLKFGKGDERVVKSGAEHHQWPETSWARAKRYLVGQKSVDKACEKYFYAKFYGGRPVAEYKHF